MTEIIELADEDLKRNYKYTKGFNGKDEDGEKGNRKY